MQKALALDEPTEGSTSAGRLRHLVLVRIACAQRGIAKPELAADLMAFAATGPAAQWRAELDRHMAALAAESLVTVKGSRAQATEAGERQAARLLGFTGAMPRVWSELRDIRLVALALGLHREPAKRLKALATLDGLRGAIVESAFNLKIKGVPTPTRIREALAATALARAFGDKGTPGLAGKLGLSAKAGRLLAAQLARDSRDYGTDTRLIAALAAEQVGSAASSVEDLRLAVLRNYFGGSPAKVPAAKRKPPKRALGKRPAPPKPERREPFTIAQDASGTIAPAPVAPPPMGRPDLPGFATEVRRCAASHAKGWSGDRKAYISHVWRNIREQRPEWGLSEIEFKCMLAEAHRAGQIALANADLKDKDNIRDVQESAVSFRNAVFHFIRVDA
jgi:hypothetical protein